MASLLKGSAFITGAASGIGKATALAFAKHGITQLALADVNLEALEAFKRALQDLYPQVDVLTLHVDVRNLEQVKAATAQVAQKFGRLDVAVNNAGIDGTGLPTHEIEDEEWLRILDINLQGVYRCQKEELSIMVKQEDRGLREGRGRIINVASLYGLVAPNSRMVFTAYATSKHGVVGLTKADANTYGALGIRINAICPGFTDTPLLHKHMSLEPDTPLGAQIQLTAMKRLTTLDEVTDGMVFLASTMSSFMQGASLTIDGGLSTI